MLQLPQGLRGGAQLRSGRIDGEPRFGPGVRISLPDAVPPGPLLDRPLQVEAGKEEMPRLQEAGAIAAQAVLQGCGRGQPSPTLGRAGEALLRRRLH